MERSIELQAHFHGIEEHFTLNKIARQADAAVMYRQKRAVLIAAVTVEEKPSDEPFLPLTVQYIEKAYAAAKIPGGYVKRETKPGDFETLTARIVDRSVRPLFPKDFAYPVTVTVMVVSSDDEVDLQVAAVHAASAALYLSSVPVEKTLAAVRIGKIDNETVLQPTLSQLGESSLDLLVVGTEEDIVMIEMATRAKEIIDDVEYDVTASALDPVVAPAPLILEHQSACEIEESALFALLEQGRNATREAAHGYRTLFAEYRKDSIDYEAQMIDATLVETIESRFAEKIASALKAFAKLQRRHALRAAREEIVAVLEAEGMELSHESFEAAFEEARRRIVRKMILENAERADGRGLREIRPIEIETNLLPSVHGSALFTRGETQVLATVTLGEKKDAQIFELLTDTRAQSERFMVHYNFPGFSVGETKPIGAPSRRELGHGNLAKRALEPAVDSKFEGVIRLVSEVLESNGSSSMATVCGGTLALRCAEVEMTDLVAGIAMGLVVEGDRYAILSDIMGLEDHDGDLDFKVAGTQHGITALQMDIKTEGIGIDILKEALMQAREGRLYILEKMREAEAQITKSEALPSVEHFSVDPAKIGEIIGRAGATIRSIIERFDVTVDLDKKEGKVKVVGKDDAGVKAAREEIEQIASKPTDKIPQYTIGQRYVGRVKKIVDFGLFVQMPEGGDALLHISKISKERIGDLHERFCEGDEIEVVVIGQRENKIELALPETLEDSEA